MDIHMFMDISLQLSMFLLISIDIYGYPCIDLLWIHNARLRLRDLCFAPLLIRSFSAQDSGLPDFQI